MNFLGVGSPKHQLLSQLLTLLGVALGEVLEHQGVDLDWVVQKTFIEVVARRGRAVGLLYYISKVLLNEECGAQARSETYDLTGDSVVRGVLVGGRSILVIRVLVDDLLIEH